MVFRWDRHDARTGQRACRDLVITQLYLSKKIPTKRGDLLALNGSFLLFGSLTFCSYCDMDLS